MDHNHNYSTAGQLALHKCC